MGSTPRSQVHDEATTPVPESWPSRRTQLRRHVALCFLSLLVVAGVGLLFGGDSGAIPVPLPTYEIITESDGHQASLANLPLGQPGVPEAPIPVDVDGDLLPDITVAVNLADVYGVFNNPPRPGKILAPNVEINRIGTLVSLLGQDAPPLRVEAKLTLIDALGTEPNTTLRFGYDTGPGGSIPPVWKATVGGLAEFFNPVQAVVDTGPSVGRPDTYDGPLRVVGGIESGNSVTDLGFGFAPFPRSVEVSYLDDDQGQHITYDHSASDEVDLRAELAISEGDEEMSVDARIDRLPSHLAIDIANAGPDAGGIAYTSESDGRKPDAAVTIESVGGDGDPLFADVDVSSIPANLAATWSLPTDGPTEVTFDAGGQGIGGVEVDVRNHPDGPDALPRRVPETEQYVAFDKLPGPDDSTLTRISGRMERVRHASFSDADGVLDAAASLGDGEKPLEVHYSCGSGCSTDGTTRLVDLDATVAPLPADFAMRILEAGADERDEPMVIDYQASSFTDVTATLALAGADSSGTEVECGTIDTTCADIAVRDLPPALTARIGRHLDPGNESDMRVSLDLESGDLSPDVTAEVVLGPADEQSDPLVAEAELLGLPEHARVFLHERHDADTEALVLDRAEFFACARSSDAEVCEPGTQGDIGALRVSLRSFLERPGGFPVPLLDREQHATVTSRPEGLEVAAAVDHIRALQYVDTGSLQGVHVDAGDGATPFGARIDIAGQEIVDPVEINDDLTLVDASRDLLADAVVTNLPAAFSMCFRTPNVDLTSAERAFTAACENDPFEDDDPMSIAYALDTGGQPGPAVDGTFETTIAGTDEDSGQPYTETMGGEASAPELPTHLTAHVRLPEADTEGPIDAHYDADAEIDVTFAGYKTIGDARCLDPRVSARALCVEGVVENIPTHARFHYDPTDPSDNLAVETANNDSGQPVNLTDLELSSVAPNPDRPDTASVLVAQGEILGLPTGVVGTIDTPEERPDGPDADDLPDPAPLTVVVESTDPEVGIGTIDVDVQNFVTPDPTPSSAPGQRAGLPPADQTITMFQRGDAFRAELFIEDLAAVGYRTARDEDGNRLDGQSMLLGFGATSPPPVVRLYADLDSGAGTSLVDVTLEDLPRRTEVCFRGAENGTAVDPTFCDTVDPDDGGIQVATAESSSGGQLDIDALFRLASGGDLLAMRAEVTDVPPIIQGTFPGTGAGSVDIGGYAESPPDPDGNVELVPDAIESIGVEVASFDVDDGYGPDRPYAPITIESEPFPAPGPGEFTEEQFVSVVAADDDIQLKGRIDDVERVQIREGACPEPGGPEDPSTRPDYPHFPAPDSFPVTDEPTSYTCVRTDFTGGSVDPLGVHAVFVDDETQISFTDGGLTNIPDWIQMTIAETPTSDANEEFRDRCGPDAPAEGEHCMPPMVRFDSADTSGTPPQLFGTLRVGTPADLRALDEVEPLATVPGGLDVDTIPSTEGARAKVDITKQGTGENAPTTVAAQINMRLGVPESLTVDQVQTWEDEIAGGDPDKNGIDAGPRHEELSDFRFHYVVRDAAGNPVPDLGHLRALVSLASGSQVLIHDPKTSEARIPGEVGVDMYMRNDIWEGRQFMQMEGRVSSPLSVGATIVSPGDDIFFGQFNGEVLNLPAVEPGTPADEPSYRLQVEVISEPEKEKDQDEEAEEECTTLSCATTDAQIEEINALVDFQPDPNQEPARLTKVVARIEETANGVQIAGFPSVHDLSHTRAPHEQEGTVPITATGNIDIDEMYVAMHEGIPLLGEVNLELDADLNASFAVHEAEDFQMRQNLMHIEAHHKGGPGSKSAIGPLDLDVYTLHADVWGLLIKLFGLDFVPGYEVDPTPAQLGYFSCQPFDPVHFTGQALGPDFNDVIDFVGNVTSENAVEVPPGEKDFLLWPLDDPRIAAGGVLGSLVDFLEPIAEPFFCLTGVSPDDLPLIEQSVPSDPLPRLIPDGEGNSVAFHPVPGYEAATFVPPSEPVPDPQPADDVNEHITEPRGMCGTHRYETLTISAPITVATSDTDWCDASEDAGELHLFAVDVIVEDGGSISADAIINNATDFNWDRFKTQYFPNSLGGDFNDWLPAWNAGGGHRIHGGRAEGDLNTSFDCLQYCYSTSPPFNSLGLGYVIGDRVPFDGPGMPGASAAFGAKNGNGGAGGGVIVINAETVTMNGNSALTANADDGDHGIDGPCATPPSWVSVNHHGDGGGAGGTVVVSALSLDMNGSSAITANGGNGGNGTFSGGPGARGVVKVLTPVRNGVAPGTNVFAEDGNPGTRTCSGTPEPGQDVQQPNSTASGVFLLPEPVDSRALPTERFWHNGEVEVDYIAGSQPDSSSDDFQVFLCGVYLPPETTTLEFAMPSGNGFGQAQGATPTMCGDGGTFVRVLDTAHRDTFVDQALVRRADKESTTAVQLYDSANLPMKDGYWGLYTVGVKPLHDGNDCVNHNDMDQPPLNGLQFDEAFCVFEAMPTQPDVVVGVDKLAPDPATITPLVTEITGGPNGTFFATNDRDIVFDINIFDTMPNSTDPGNPNNRVPISGVYQTACIDETDGDLWLCPPGSGGAYTLKGGDGVKEIRMFTQDRALNSSEDTTYVLLDTTVPTSDVDTIQAPDLLNGWFSTTPDVGLFGYGDGEIGVTSAGPHPDGHFVWKADEGQETPCGLNCTISSADLPDEGRIEIRHTGHDAAGNRYPMDALDETPDNEPFVIKVDDTAPLVDLHTAPFAPDGANGYFTTKPWVGLTAFDLPVDGSGVVPGPGDDPGAGIYYTLTSNGQVMVSDELYTGPFDLGDGEHVVCWRAVDVAGNETPVTECSDPILVDMSAPTASLSVSGPLGDNGWYTGVVTVEAGGSDLPPGIASGVDTTVAPSGVWMAVDDGPYVPAGPKISIGEGEHVVRAYSVDVAGNRSDVQEHVVNVDHSVPVVAARTFVPAPAQDGWFRSEPAVVLRATDGAENAGVAEIQYRIDGGPWETYDGPIQLDDGHSTVEYRALDRSGSANDSAIGGISAKADVTPPTAVATQANRLIWSRLLGPNQLKLTYEVGDDLSGELDVEIVIYDVLGNPVRRLDAGPVTVLPGDPPIAGTVAWDGRSGGLTSLVPLGVYHFRTVTTDEAGNVAVSGESKPITIRLL